MRRIREDTLSRLPACGRAARNSHPVLKHGMLRQKLAKTPGLVDRAFYPSTVRETASVSNRSFEACPMDAPTTPALNRALTCNVEQVNNKSKEAPQISHSTTKAAIKYFHKMEH